MKKRKKWLIGIACFLSVVLLISSSVYIFGFWLPNYNKTKEWKRNVQAYREAKMARFIEENERYADYEIEVAFIGDSLTDLYELEKYYPQYKTSNRGIGGDTTYDLEDRLQVSLYDLKPQVVVMLIGANNVETMLENYNSILRGIKTNLPQSEVVLLSMTAMGGEAWGSRNQMAAYNNVSIKLLAKEYGYAFVDLFTPLYDVSIGEVYEGYTIDGAHFTPKGYEVITAQISPVLEEIFANKQGENNETSR